VRITITSLALITIAIVLAISSTAETAPISSIIVVDPNPPYQAGNYMLLSATVGGYTVSPASSPDTPGLQTGTTTAQSIDPPPINQDYEADDFNLNTFCRRGTEVGGVRTVDFGGRTLWMNTNGNDPDFFIFETGRNDSINVHAILPDGSGGEILGQAINFPTGGWGLTGLSIQAHPTENNNQHGGQLIVGLAFSITDLLDENGANLTNDDAILGIFIDNAGVDPASISAVYVPEPSTFLLLGLGVFLPLPFVQCSIRKRKMRQGLP